MKDGYDHLMNNKEFKKILEAREVDLIIVDAILNEFVLPIIDHLQVPFIFYCTTTGAPWVMEMFNIPHDYATVPTGTGDERGQMSFIERLNNMWSSESFKLLRKIFLINMMDNYVKKEFPNSRTIAEIERDAQLCFINSHPATSWTRTLPPHVIPLGALHVRPSKPLPNELQVMADNAVQGFIVFSLGSTIPVSSMPGHVVQMFTRVFSRIPEYVIWKWEKNNVLVDNLSDNVKIVDWLPQQDLLGHKNSRLFISHGGLLGIQETVYHGVPILGIPFGNDQLGNMAKVCDEGYGLKLSWGELSEELLYNTIQLLLHEPSFQGNATRLSKLMRDPVMPGRELGVYWVEHVLRHGGKHLMSPSKNMPFYKAYLLDVWLFLILINCTIFYVIVKSLTFIVQKLKDSKVKVQ